jgi:uncharacterized membrane protein YfcA
MLMWLGTLLVVLMGISLGLLGGGGSILAVPILVYVIGLDAHHAIALSLLLVGGTAVLGAGLHHRNCPLAWREPLLFAACGVPFSFLGGVVSRRFPGAILLLLFGVLMITVGSLMFRPRPEPHEGKRGSAVLLALVGGGVGFLTGFLGVGGGFLIVPAFILLLHMPTRRAIGASLVVIAINCASALVGHWPSLEMQWRLIVPLSVAALAGSLAGVELSKRFSPRALRHVFGVFVVIIGVVIVLRNLPAF